MTNQLQKDIKTALSWYQYLPQHQVRHQDVKSFHRLECYINKENTDSYPELHRLAEKYNFQIEDLPDILEEYILTDNNVIEQKNIEYTIKEAYENERTQLGRSVLKQLLEKIQ